MNVKLYIVENIKVAGHMNCLNYTEININRARDNSLSLYVRHLLQCCRCDCPLKI